MAEKPPETKPGKKASTESTEWLAMRAAWRALVRAQDEGKAPAIARAERHYAEAIEAYKTKNRRRFDRIAKMRTETAVRAIEQLETLCRLPRYGDILTTVHEEQISTAISEAFERLKKVMASAILAPTIRDPRRRELNFEEQEGAQ